MIKPLVYDISTGKARSKLKAETQFHLGRNCSDLLHILQLPACWADAYYDTRPSWYRRK